MNKFGASKACSDYFPGVVFASIAEKDRAEYLLAEQREGKLTDLVLQPAYVLRAKPKRVYTADAGYRENGREIVEDVKGAVTEAASLRMAWMREKYPEVVLRVVKRDRRLGWSVTEVK